MLLCETVGGMPSHDGLLLIYQAGMQAADMISLKKYLKSMSEHCPTWLGHMLICQCCHNLEKLLSSVPFLCLSPESWSLEWFAHQSPSQSRVTNMIFYWLMSTCTSNFSKITLLIFSCFFCNVKGTFQKFKRTAWPTRWITQRCSWTSPAQTP